MARDAILRNVTVVARALGDDLEQVVLAGASAAAFYDFTPSVVDFRPTLDVDLIVETLSRPAFDSFVMRVRARAKVRDLLDDPGAPICRYEVDGVLVDFLPVEGSVLGFVNRWYPAAVRTATRVRLDGQREIRVISPIHFVATKLLAFFDPCRGGRDFLASHDLEDILAVLAGHPSLLADVATGTQPVHEWLREQFASLLADRSFRDAVPGHLAAGMLPPVDASGFLDRMERMVRGDAPGS